MPRPDDGSADGDALTALVEYCATSTAPLTTPGLIQYFSGTAHEGILASLLASAHDQQLTADQADEQLRAGVQRYWLQAARNRLSNAGQTPDDDNPAANDLSAEDTERMLSVSEQGYGKQTPITTYRLQSRGGKGVINMKTTDKTGKVVAVFPVDDESEIMIITQQGKLIRLEAGLIRRTGRSAQGVRLIKTDASDMVTSASLVEPSVEDELEDAPA